MSNNHTPPAPEMVKSPLELKDIIKLLIVHYGLHEGDYDLAVEYQIGVGPARLSDDRTLPGVMMGLSKIGLVKSAKKTQQTVNAADVNPLKQKKTAKKQATDNADK